jgi:sarcosine oxidase subunit beta
MVDEADVVIVGGGVVGLSIARSLGRAGRAGVVVLERDPAVGQEASSRANGGFRAQFTTEPNVAFSLASIEEFERMAGEHGDVLSFHQLGYLFIAGTEEAERSLREAARLQRSLGVRTEWLEPDEVLGRVPIVRPQGIRGGTFHARDGFLDPHGLMTALRADARAAGVEIDTNADVRAIHRRTGGPDAGGGFEVDAGARSFRCRWVVDAAGADAREVAALLDVDVPVEPVRRNAAYFHDPSGSRELIPMCIDVDTGVLLRRDESGGFLVHYADPNDPPTRDTSFDPRFLEALAERIGNRFPFLEACPLDEDQCWAGLYPETPDHHAIIGEAPGVPGFVLAVGFGGHGVMHAPAAGQAVAELITLGRSETFDLAPLRPSRFAERDLVVERAVL